MTRAADGLLGAGRVVVLALVLALPLLAGYMFTDRILWAGALAMAGTLLVCAAAGLGADGVRRGLGGAAWPLGGLLAWSALAAAQGVYLHGSLVSLVGMGAALALLAVAASAFRDEPWRRGAWVSVAAAGTVEGLLGLRDWTQTVIFQGDPSWRIFGSMFNPNVLAGYLLAVLPAAVVVLALAWRSATAQEQEGPRLGLIAAAFALLIPSAALLLTGSRAGLLGAAVGAVVMVVAAPTRIPRRWLLLAGVALVLLTALAPPVRNRILSATTQSHSALFRWYTWKGTVGMIAARPLLGFGPGSFEHAYPRYAQAGFTRMAHQTPLQIAAEAGLPALALVAAAVGMIACRLGRGVRFGGLTALQAAAGLAALVGLGVQNLADYTWYVPAVGMTLAATVGLALAAVRDAEATGEGAGRRRWLCWAGAALALLIIAGCGVGLRAQVLAGRGRLLMAQGRHAMAAGWLRQAVEVDPLDAELWAELAQASAGAGPGGVERAVVARLRAAQLNHLDAGNYLALAALYDAVGEVDSALAAAREAIAVHPNWPRAYVVLAQLQLEQGLEEEALGTWRALEQVYRSPVGRYQAVEGVTDYSYAWAWLALGQEAEESGKAVAAADYYRRAARMAGEFARLQRAREETLRSLGTWDEAEVAEAERLRDAAQRGLQRLGAEKREQQ
ncbi:MAG: O-antigen ligase family protein [Armatimonadota bacterium]